MSDFVKVHSHDEYLSDPRVRDSCACVDDGVWIDVICYQDYNSVVCVNHNDCPFELSCYLFNDALRSKKQCGHKEDQRKSGQYTV